MTEERRLKIQKIKKYEEELDSEKSKIVLFSLVLGIAALVSFTTKLNSAEYIFDNDLYFYCTNLGAEVLANVGIALNSANLMISITNRTKLKSKIDEIKEELGPLFDLYEEQYEQEENRGRGR